MSCESHETDKRASRDYERTPGRWAPQRGFWPHPDSGYPWAWTPTARGGPGGALRLRASDDAAGTAPGVARLHYRLPARDWRAAAHPSTQRPPRAARAPQRPRRRRIDSFTPYTIIHTVSTTDASSAPAPPRERAARARAPPPARAALPPRPHPEHAHRAPTRTTTPIHPTPKLYPN
ncbi:hypothetical protein SFRURICE_008968 [Spodoptera frugiperda]|nr:hypothetical protein SFRURICE_008968 [Spodoptera frugiperda]